MLVTVAFILVVLWFMGLFLSLTLNGFIHVLIVGAVLMALLRVMKVERPIS